MYKSLHRQCRKEAAAFVESRRENCDIGESTGVTICDPDPDRFPISHSKLPLKMGLVNDGTLWLHFVSDPIWIRLRKYKPFFS